MSDFSLSYPEGSLPLEVVRVDRGTGRARRGQAAHDDRPRDAGLRLQEHRVVRIGDHLHRRRRRASCATAATRSSSSPGRPRSSRCPTCSSTASLPTAVELAQFQSQVARHTLLHEDLKWFFDGFPRDAHPMAVLSSAVSALSAFYQDSLDPFDREQVEISTVRLLAKVPTIAAYAYKKSIGQPFLYPDNSLGYVDNFLRLTFGVPAEPYEVDPLIAKTLDMLFVLHADHEQNCSTSTVRLVGSSHANLFASVSAGVNALFGPLHGGANQAVMEMLNQIQADGGDVDRFVRRVKDKEPGVKLMGFGHPVYRNYDPRATIIKQAAHDVLERHGRQRPAARHRAAARGGRAR